MATIRKKGEYQWHVQIRKPGFKQVTRTFTSFKAAKEFERETESAMERGVYQENAESASTTIETLAKKYIEEITPSKKNQIEDERLMKVVIHKFGKYYLSNIKPLMIKTWLDELKKKGLANSTINHHLSAISSLIDTAVKEWGYALHQNPCKLVKRMPSGKARDRRLLDGEEDRIITECIASRNIWLLPAVKLSIFTGMRQGELFKLEWENINFEDQTAELLDTKNGDDRVVPLSSKAVLVLNEMPGERRGKVFKCSQHGVASSLRSAIARAKACYLEECRNSATEPQNGFLEDLRLHDLRHEATSRFFEKDLNVMEVASITGHKTLSMLKRYTHLKAKNIVKKLD